MFTKFLSAVFALALIAGAASAQPDAKKPDEKKLVTRTYNLKNLLSERGKAGGVGSADAVVKVIIDAVPELGELKPGADGPQIVELDNRLEIRTTEKAHGEIKDLLDALERLIDLAIDVKVDVIEFDAASYEKLLKAIPKQGKKKAPVLFATDEGFEEAFDNQKDEALDKELEQMNKILRAGRTVQTSSGRFVNGSEATISARKTLTTLKAGPLVVRVGDKANEPQFVKEGFALAATPVISADRRFVRLKLTEHSTVVSGVKKRDFGENIVLQTLETEDLGATGSATIQDGGTMLFKLAYAPKDKVWVAVIKPQIYIQAEEDELKKDGKKPGS